MRAPALPVSLLTAFVVLPVCVSRAHNMPPDVPLIELAFEPGSGDLVARAGVWSPADAVAEADAALSEGDAAEGKGYLRLSVRAARDGDLRYRIPVVYRAGAEGFIALSLRAAELPPGASASVELWAGDAALPEEDIAPFAREPIAETGVWRGYHCDLGLLRIAGPTCHLSHVCIALTGMPAGSRATVDLDALRLVGDDHDGFKRLRRQLDPATLNPTAPAFLQAAGNRLGALPEELESTASLEEPHARALDSARAWYRDARADVVRTMAAAEERAARIADGSLPLTESILSEAERVDLAERLSELECVAAQPDQAEEARLDAPWAMWVSPVSRWRLPAPTDAVVFGALRSRLAFPCAPGESRHILLTLRPARGLHQLTITPGPLSCGSGPGIPAERWDVRHVVSWTQATEGLLARGEPRLTPELLLRSPTPPPSPASPTCEPRPFLAHRPWWMITKMSALLAPDEVAPPSGAFLPADADATQPVDAPAGELHTFALSLSPPAGLRGGLYQGEVTIASEEASVTVPVSVDLLPAELQATPLHVAAELRSCLGDADVADLSRLSEASMRAVLQDMQYLGANAITLGEEIDHHPMQLEAARRALALRRDLGVIGSPTIAHTAEKVYREVIFLAANKESDPAAYQDIVHALGETAQALRMLEREYELDGFALAGLPGASSDWTGYERNLAELVAAEIGIETFIEAQAHISRRGAGMGFVSVPLPTPMDLSVASEGGFRLWCCPPSVGLERPARLRREAGFWLVGRGFQGLYLPYWRAFGDPTNDFDAPAKDMMLAYPSPAGPIRTVQWLAAQEAIFDLRYLATADRIIAEQDAAGRGGFGARGGAKHPAVLRLERARAWALGGAEPEDARAELHAAIAAACDAFGL